MSDNQKIQELMKSLAELNIGSYLTSADEQKRFKRTVLDVVNYDSNLQEVPVESIIQCAVKGASLKLELNRHFNMVPRSDRKGGPKLARFELTYQGYVTLLSRSGIVVRANVVYDNDTFDIDLAEEMITHKPYLRGARGEPIGVYAIINIDDRKIIDYMSWTEIQEFKTKYLAYESGAWKKSPTEMAKKTILKRTAKPYIHTDSVEDTVREAQMLDNATETQDGLTLGIVKAKPQLDLSKITVDVSALPNAKQESESVKEETVADLQVDTSQVKSEVKDKKPVTEKQIKRLFGILNQSLPKDQRQIWLDSVKETYKLESIKDLTMSQYDEVLKPLETLNVQA